MELGNNNVEKPTSVLERDGCYADRLLIREALIGCSSHIYYGTGGRVPFQWEMQPGTPINRQKSEKISPLTLPPAIQNIGLPLPSLETQKEPSLKTISKRFMFWKKMKKIESRMKENMETTGSDRIERSDHFDSDDDFGASFRKSSSLTSSSSVCSSDFPHLEQPRKPFVCSTWDITTKLVGFAKRG